VVVGDMEKEKVVVERGVRGGEGRGGGGKSQRGDGQGRGAVSRGSRGEESHPLP
jgi:hypothetical protein